jgi:transcriptional regulator with XRE-family HTH domain
MTSPHGQRDRLAAELKRLRVLAGMSGREVARLTGLSQSTVSRVETGRAVPSLDEVRDWAKAVRASADTRRQLVALAEAAASEVIAFAPWLRGNLEAGQEYVRGLEAQAKTVRNFQPFLVPGLLQTPDYAQAILAIANPNLQFSAADLSAAAVARRDRQAALHDPERSFEFILTEHGLRWSPGGMASSVLAAQLSRVADAATMPNVSIGVIKSGVQTRVSLRVPFVLYEDIKTGVSTAPITLAAVETPVSRIEISDPADIKVYQDHLAGLRAAADFGAAALVF